MSDFSIIIKDEEMQFQFKKLLDRGTNTRPLMAKLVQQLHFAVDENFEKEGRPRRWRPLSRNYAAQKRKQGFSSKILERSGTLRRSLTEKYTNTEAIVGTNLKYAGVHQFGSTRKNIPARPFLKVTKSDLIKFTDVVKYYIMDNR